jgi:hypothetical protein
MNQRGDHYERSDVLVRAIASQDGAELIIASLVRRYWNGQALQVPWVRTAYPKQARPV